MELKTKRNRLTRYALACGYVERAISATKRVTLLMEGSAIRIDTYDSETGHRGMMQGGNMKTARERFQHLIGAWGLKRIPNA